MTSFENYGNERPFADPQSQYPVQESPETAKKGPKHRIEGTGLLKKMGLQ